MRGDAGKHEGKLVFSTLDDEDRMGLMAIIISYDHVSHIINAFDLRQMHRWSYNEDHFFQKKLLDINES